MPAIRLWLVCGFACCVAFGCSCGRPGQPTSDEDATRAAIPAWETMTALTPSPIPHPTPTPVPPLVAITLASPDEITGSALYVMDLRSKEIMQISGRVSLEAWLPDGRMIVGGGDVEPRSYLIDPSTNVSPKLLPDWPLVVSPDGRLIVAIRENFPSSNIAMFPTDEPDATSTTTYPGQVESIAWSADSAWLAIKVIHVFSGSEVLVAALADLNSWRKLGDAEAFAWSPSGARIALASENEITLFDLNSGEVRGRALPPSLLASTTWQNLWHGEPPSASLSPDSRYLAISDGFNTDVIATDSTGGAEMKSAHFQGWLADGPVLAVSGPMCSKAMRLMLVSPDGIIERTFDDERARVALPSPGGLRLAVEFASDAATALKIIDASGDEQSLLSISRGVPPLTAGYASLSPIAWSADGRKLAFGVGGNFPVCHQDYTPGELDIHPIQ